MSEFKITAWPIDDVENKDEPKWEYILEAENISNAHSEGTRIFKKEHPDLDYSKYILHASDI